MIRSRLPHAAGVYAITNLVNGKVYVGSSLNIARRIAAHKCYLNAGTHKNEHLQRAWKKYGVEAFAFAVAELVLGHGLIETEQKYIDRLRSGKPEYGYNSVPFAVAGRAKKTSKQRAAMSAWAKRRWAEMSPETREWMLAKQRARTMSPEMKQRLSLSQKSSPSTLERLRRLAQQQRGVPLSDKHRQAVSAALIGRPHSPEHTAAIILAKQRNRALREAVA